MSTNGNEWIMLDNKLNDKIESVMEKIDCNLKSNNTLHCELNDIKTEVIGLKEDIKGWKAELGDVKMVFKDWKEHLEKSRMERLNVLEEIRGFLNDNRELYMKEFVKETDRLSKIEENGKKIETKLTPEYQLRRDNRSWRQFGIMGYKSGSSIE